MGIFLLGRNTHIPKVRNILISFIPGDQVIHLPVSTDYQAIYDGYIEADALFFIHWHTICMYVFKKNLGT